MPDAQGRPTDQELREQIIGALSSDAKAKPSKAADLEILRDPDGNPLGYRDLSTGAYFPIPAPKAPAVDITSPADTTWVDIAGPVQQGQTPQQQGHRIVNGQLVPISGLTRAKPSSDTSGAPQWIPDPQDPTKEIQVVYSGTTALPVSANGAVVSRPKKAEPTAGPTNVGGARWIPDPKNPANEIEVVTTLSPDGTPTNKPTGATRKAPAAAPTAAGNVIWQDIADQPGKQQGGTLVEGKFVPVEGLTKDKDKKAVAVYGTGTNDRYRIAIDEEGKVVSKEDNPNYVGEKPTQLTADLVAPNIPLLKPDGSVTWVENRNRVPANQAMSDLLAQVGVKVNAGQMSMADAKDLLTGTVNVMNAQTEQTSAQTAQQTVVGNAAKDTLANIQNAAQTGAGMLNQRAATAQGMVQGGLDILGQTKHGLLVAPGGDFGQNLVQGAAGFATELGGGPEVYQAAANLVRRADPNGALGQDAAGAYAAFAQLLQGYRNATGGVPHPVEALATGATQPQSHAQPAALPATPFQAPPPQTPGPSVSSPGQVAGQNYGAATAYSGGVSPWNAVPSQSFVAPPPLPTLPSQSKQITINVPVGL